MLFERQWHRCRKKFYRRTALITFLCYASILHAVQDDEIRGRNKQFRFLGRGPGQHLSKPFSPHVKVLSSSEVQVSWLPIITHGGPFLGRYELFIGDEMEYVGHDLEYIAKRLKPGNEYSFKIRACGVELGTCSDFSFPRYATTDAQPRFGGRSESAMTSTYLGKRRICLIILTAILGPIAVIALMISVFLFFRNSSGRDPMEADCYGAGHSGCSATTSSSCAFSKYMFYHLRHTPCLPLDGYDPEVQFNTNYKKQEDEFYAMLKYGDHFDAINGSQNLAFTSSPYEKVSYEFEKGLQKKVDDVVTEDKKDCKQFESEEESGSQDISSNDEVDDIPQAIDKDPGKEEFVEEQFSSSSSSEEEKLEEGALYMEVGYKDKKHGLAKSSEESLTKSARPRVKSMRKQHREKRGRARTLSDSERAACQGRNVSTEKVANDQTDGEASITEADNIVVVVDNSNIFIGGRETACAECPGLKQRHVKLRLHALVKTLEKRRHVTMAYAGGSSPPGNPLVWDVYRRLGYVVDLEDRRGKDEQRVDELLHLSIYKALVELPPQTLVLATGDGSKGKSNGETSFPKCAEAALEQGWKVEVHSWRHCMSAEWLRIAAKYRTRLKIHYLDEHLHELTFIEYKTRRLTGTSHDSAEKGASHECHGKQNDGQTVSQISRLKT